MLQVLHRQGLFMAGPGAAMVAVDGGVGRGWGAAAKRVNLETHVPAS